MKRAYLFPRLHWPALVFAAGALACEAPAPGLVVGDIELAAPPASGEANLVATSDGRVILTWLERSGSEKFALRFAVRDGKEWSSPSTIVESDRFFVNWADFPSLVELPDGTWIVHWLEKVATSTYAYHVKLAISRDQGATWSEPIVPHRDDSPLEHGFVSMVPWGDGAALVWLDGREMTSADGRAGEGEELDSGEMGVRATTISAAGALGADELLDRRACECCQTALASTARGLVAAYRDRSEAEVRDIAVVRLVDGRWSEPTHVAIDNWVFPGCPVNGPQLSADGDRLVIAWFTAAEQIPAVYVAFSEDAGESFGTPVRIDDGDALGRVDVELLSDGSALVTWLERTPKAAEDRARRVLMDGELGGGDAWLVAQTSEARSSGFPRMVRSGDEIVFAWTLPGDEGGVRVAAAAAP